MNFLILRINYYKYFYHVTDNSDDIKWDSMDDTALEKYLEIGEWNVFFPTTVQILKFPPSIIPLTIHLNAQTLHA
jgi:hypothetical protein